MDGGSPSASKSFAVPISKFQSDVLRLLAAQRSPDSYIAGGIAINRQGPRFSGDIDIFHDSAARQESAVKADEAALASAGYTIIWPPNQRTGTHEAAIEKDGEQMQLEWVTDSAFRFFQRSRMNCLATCCTPSIWPPTRRQRRQTVSVSGRPRLWRCSSDCGFGYCIQNQGSRASI